MAQKNTLERMAVIETKIEGIKDTVERNCNSNDEAHSEIKKSLVEINDKIDKKCAGKWVETFIYALVTGGCIYFIYKIIDLVINSGKP